MIKNLQMIKVVLLDSKLAELKTTQLEHTHGKDLRLNLAQIVSVLTLQGIKLAIHDFQSEILVKSKNGSWSKNAKVFESKTYGLVLKNDKKRNLKEMVKKLPTISNSSFK